MNYPNHSSPLRWAFLLPIALVILVLMAVPKNPIPNPADVQISEISHAEAEHGADALAVRSCLKNNGARQVWSLDNKIYFVCKLPDGKWGLQIAEKINGKLQEVTAYIKERFTSLEQMADYLSSNGASCLKGGLPR